MLLASQRQQFVRLRKRIFNANCYNFLFKQNILVQLTVNLTTTLLDNIVVYVLLPARRYASAGLCDSDVSVRLSVCPSVRPSVCLSHAGIVPSRAKAGS